MYIFSIIASFFLLNAIVPSHVLAACPSTINNSDVTITSNDNCSLSALNTYYIDQASSEISTTNDGSLTLSGGSLTIANTSKLVVGRLIPNGGTIIIQNGGSIDVNATPTWVVDSDADGYPLNFTTYTATATGRRRLGLMRSTTDCNDGSNQVYFGHAQCHKDSDGDTYTGGLSPDTTCLNSISCDTATRASASTHGATVTSYTAGRLKDNASASADCYDNNANAKPGSTYCGTTNRGDGSFDYNCSSSSTKCGTTYNRSAGSQLNEPCKTNRCQPVYVSSYITATINCGQTGYVCTANGSACIDCDVIDGSCGCSTSVTYCSAASGGIQACQ